MNDRKQMFSQEMARVRQDLPGADLTDLGLEWAFKQFSSLCDRYEDKAGRDFMGFEADARREARIIILESIAIDNESKKRVIASTNSFGE